jgi:hypothetical protein
MAGKAMAIAAVNKSKRETVRFIETASGKKVPAMGQKIQKRDTLGRQFSSS